MKGHRVGSVKVAKPEEVEGRSWGIGEKHGLDARLRQGARSGKSTSC